MIKSLSADVHAELVKDVSEHFSITVVEDGTDVLAEYICLVMAEKDKETVLNELQGLLFFWMLLGCMCFEIFRDP